MIEPSSEYEPVSMYVYAEHTTNHHIFHMFDPDYNYMNDPLAILCTKSTNPLINSIIVGNYPTTIENLITVAGVVKYIQELKVANLKEMRVKYNALVYHVVNDLKKYNKAKADINVFSVLIKYLKTDEKKEEVKERIADQTVARDELGPAICERVEKSYELLEMYAVIGGIIGLKADEGEWNPVPIFCGSKWGEKPPELSVEVPFVRQIIWD